MYWMRSGGETKLLAESIATASPWCAAVLYLPDPPFLFGGGSGYKTSQVAVAMIPKKRGSEKRPFDDSSELHFNCHRVA